MTHSPLHTRPGRAGLDICITPAFPIVTCGSRLHESGAHRLLAHTVAQSITFRRDPGRTGLRPGRPGLIVPPQRRAVPAAAEHRPPDPRSGPATQHRTGLHPGAPLRNPCDVGWAGTRRDRYTAAEGLWGAPAETATGHHDDRAWPEPPRAHHLVPTW